MDDFVIRQMIGLVACSVVIWRVEPALNRMGPGTHDSVRVALWMALLGSIAHIWWILIENNAPDWLSISALTSFAGLVLCERRIRVLTRRSRTPHHR